MLAFETLICNDIPETEDSSMSTIVVRGATESIMDDVERAIDDGVNTFKTITKVCWQDTDVIGVPEESSGYRPLLRKQ